MIANKVNLVYGFVLRRTRVEYQRLWRALFEERAVNYSSTEADRERSGEYQANVQSALESQHSIVYYGCWQDTGKGIHWAIMG